METQLLMYGIVAMLDTKHDAMVEALWAEFRQKFGVHGVSAAPIPHFSFHLAERYDVEQVGQMLRRFAMQLSPFIVQTNGLGVFTGAEPVLFIPVIRSLKLINLQARLWNPLSQVAVNPSPLYHPEAWRPHITLAHRDVDHELLPQVVRLLSERDFRWEIPIDTLGVLSDKSEPDDDIMLRVRLGTGDVF
jgi:2'-5' RNA ligase